MRKGYRVRREKNMESLPEILPKGMVQEISSVNIIGSLLEMQNLWVPV